MNTSNKRKMIVAALAALCTLSTQAFAAADDQDVMYDCKVATENGGTRYYFRESAGKLTYTTTASSATTYTFIRGADWVNSTAGASYFMISKDLCNGLGLDTDAVKGRKIETNWNCDAARNSRVVRLDTIDTTDFSIRLKSSDTLYFSPGSLVSGGSVILDTKNSTSWKIGQRHFTTSCRNVDFESVRPLTGT
jgi:hypothetical protein